MNKPLIDAIKEFFRIILIAVIPVVIDQIQTTNGINWKIIATIGAIAALKSIDEYLHELGKEKDNESLTLGLTRF